MGVVLVMVAGGATLRQWEWSSILTQSDSTLKES
jgi:hypothetical protein